MLCVLQACILQAVLEVEPIYLCMTRRNVAAKAVNWGLCLMHAGSCSHGCQMPHQWWAGIWQDIVKLQYCYCCTSLKYSSSSSSQRTAGNGVTTADHNKSNLGSVASRCSVCLHLLIFGWLYAFCTCQCLERLTVIDICMHVSHHRGRAHLYKKDSHGLGMK